MESTPIRPFMTIREVAGVLGYSRQHTYRLVAQGLLPSVRTSERTIRIPRAAFEAWLEVQAERAVSAMSGLWLVSAPDLTPEERD